MCLLFVHFRTLTLIILGHYGTAADMYLHAITPNPNVKDMLNPVTHGAEENSSFMSLNRTPRLLNVPWQRNIATKTLRATSQAQPLSFVASDTSLAVVSTLVDILDTFETLMSSNDMYVWYDNVLKSSWIALNTALWAVLNQCSLNFTEVHWTFTELTLLELKNKNLPFFHSIWNILILPLDFLIYHCK